MNKLGTDFLFITLYRVLTVLTPLITSPYVSRILGAEQLGLFSATYAHVNYFILICMLGVEFYGIREISPLVDKEDIRKRFWEIYIVQFIASIISISLYSVTISFLNDNRLYVAKWQIIWLFAAMFDINWLFFAIKEFKITVYRNLLIKIVCIILLFYVVNSANDLISYIILMSSSLLVSNVILWPIAFRKCGAPVIISNNFYHDLVNMLRLFLPVVCLSIFQITDKTMVDLFSDNINSGCYYNVDRLINMPISIVLGLSAVMLPRLVYINKNMPANVFYDVIKETFEVTVSIAFLIAFGMASVSYEFVPAFFGEGYELCIPMLIASIPVIIFKSLEEFVRSQYLIPKKLDNIYIKGVAYAALVNFFSNFFLIKSYGALGAVYGTFIAELFLFLYQSVLIKDKIKFINLLFNNSYYLLSSVLMFVIIRILLKSFMVKDMLHIMTVAFLGMIFYLSLCLIYGFFNSNSVYSGILVCIIKKLKLDKLLKLKIK